jgi:hypothetical protein
VIDFVHFVSGVILIAISLVGGFCMGWRVWYQSRFQMVDARHTNISNVLEIDESFGFDITGMEVMQIIEGEE